MNPTLRILFKIVSYVFHPLLLPTYGTLLYLWANPSIEYNSIREDGSVQFSASLVIITIFINTLLMPAISILVMKGIGFVKTLEMEDKQERIIPFIATMTFYIWAFLVAKNQFDFMPPIYTIFILGTVIAVMISFFINIFYKLSIHMVGMGGMLTGVMMMMLTSERALMGVLILVIVLNGLVATARLYLRAHTFREVYIGFIVGICSQMLAFTFYTKFVN